MSSVTRLLTFVDLDDAGDAGADARRMSVTARHEAVLEDGRRVVLLDDRGWSEQQAGPSIWASETVEGLERSARDVVGPDEPVEGITQAEMEAGHWETLASTLRARGVDADPAELRALRHDVELSPRLRARLPRAS